MGYDNNVVFVHFIERNQINIGYSNVSLEESGLVGSLGESFLSGEDRLVWICPFVSIEIASNIYEKEEGKCYTMLKMKHKSLSNILKWTELRLFVFPFTMGSSATIIARNEDAGIITDPVPKPLYFIWGLHWWQQINNTQEVVVSPRRMKQWTKRSQLIM